MVVSVVVFDDLGLGEALNWLCDSRWGICDFGTGSGSGFDWCRLGNSDNWSSYWGSYWCADELSQTLSWCSSLVSNNWSSSCSWGSEGGLSGIGGIGSSWFALGNGSLGSWSNGSNGSRGVLNTASWYSLNWCALLE